MKEEEGPEEGVYEGWMGQRGNGPEAGKFHILYKNNSEDGWEPRGGAALVARLRNWCSVL